MRACFVLECPCVCVLVCCVCGCCVWLCGRALGCVCALVLWVCECVWLRVWLLCVCVFGWLCCWLTGGVCVSGGDVGGVGGRTVLLSDVWYCPVGCVFQVADGCAMCVDACV